jgi:hypothetical protein
MIAKETLFYYISRSQAPCPAIQSAAITTGKNKQLFLRLPKDYSFPMIIRPRVYKKRSHTAEKNADNNHLFFAPAH